MDQSQFPNILPSDVALGKKKKKITLHIPGLVPVCIFHKQNLSRAVLFLGFPDEGVEVQEGEESRSRSHS